jgi:hypothetical protein
MLNHQRKTKADDFPVPQLTVVPAAETAAPASPWAVAEESLDDSLIAFRTENEPVAPSAVRVHGRTVALAAVVVVALGASWFGWRTWSTSRASAAPAPIVRTGTAVFSSVPDGALISIDGVARGTTPMRVSLDAGAHSVQITSGTISRTIPITVEPGAVVSQYVELAVGPPFQGGRVEIGSDPAGAEVRIDGVLKGVTPLVVADVPPGQRRITVSGRDGVVNRNVNVTSGATSTVVVSASATSTQAASGGWLTIDSPIEMEISEGGRLLGTTRTERLMLPVGSHRIDLANAPLEFVTTRTVDIAAGKTLSVSVALPNGKLSVNAVPWADVSIDGQSYGTTPLGDLQLPIGTHEVAFRHPQLGEKRQTVTVKAEAPARVGVDLRK